MDNFDAAERQHEEQQKLMDGYIRLPDGVNLQVLVAKAYELSAPAGMGWVHFEPGPLPDHIATALVGNLTSEFPVNLDYVKGRSVKLTVTRLMDGSMYVPRRWFDHSSDQYRQLLQAAGVPLEGAELQEGVRY